MENWLQSCRSYTQSAERWKDGKRVAEVLCGRTYQGHIYRTVVAPALV